MDQRVTGLVTRDLETVELRGTLSCRDGEVGYGLRLTSVSERQDGQAGRVPPAGLGGG